MTLPLAALGLLMLGTSTPGTPATFHAGTARTSLPRLSFVLLQLDDSIRAGDVSTPLGGSLWRWTVYIQAPEDVLQRQELEHALEF